MRLREAGFDVTWVVEFDRGAGDADLWTRAAHEDRFILTFDADFERTHRRPQPGPPGVVLLKLKRQRREDALALVEEIIQDPSRLVAGHVNVLSKGRRRPPSPLFS